MSRLRRSRLVVGYVRPTPGDRPGAADGAIIGYATRHDLAMKRIHRDDPAEPGQGRRPRVPRRPGRPARGPGHWRTRRVGRSPLPGAAGGGSPCPAGLGGRRPDVPGRLRPCPAAPAVRLARSEPTSAARLMSPRPGRVADLGVLPASAVPEEYGVTGPDQTTCPESRRPTSRLVGPRSGNAPTPGRCSTGTSSPATGPIADRGMATVPTGEHLPRPHVYATPPRPSPPC